MKGGMDTMIGIEKEKIERAESQRRIILGKQINRKQRLRKRMLIKFTGIIKVGGLNQRKKNTFRLFNKPSNNRVCNKVVKNRKNSNRTGNHLEFCYNTTMPVKELH